MDKAAKEIFGIWQGFCFVLFFVVYLRQIEQLYIWNVMSNDLTQKLIIYGLVKLTRRSCE